MYNPACKDKEILKWENIFVQLVTPPDTDTPGYADDRMGMPEQTRLLCETAGLFKPEE